MSKPRVAIKVRPSSRCGDSRRFRIAAISPVVNQPSPGKEVALGSQGRPGGRFPGSRDPGQIDQKVRRRGASHPGAGSRARGAGPSRSFDLVAALRRRYVSSRFAARKRIPGLVGFHGVRFNGLGRTFVLCLEEKSRLIAASRIPQFLSRSKVLRSARSSQSAMVPSAAIAFRARIRRGGRFFRLHASSARRGTRPKSRFEQISITRDHMGSSPAISTS